MKICFNYFKILNEFYDKDNYKGFFGMENIFFKIKTSKLSNNSFTIEFRYHNILQILFLVFLHINSTYYITKSL